MRTRDLVKRRETMVEGRKKIGGADQSEAWPNQGKNWETVIGRHPLNRALCGRCGEETGRLAEIRGKRVAVGIQEE